MRTRGFHLTEEQAAELQAAFVHCRDANAKTRYQAVRLYGVGHPVAQITDICACSPRSLLHWIRAYQDEGLTALLDHRRGGNRARLTPEQIEHLHNQLHQYTPAHCWEEKLVLVTVSSGTCPMSPACFRETMASPIRV